MEKVIKDLTQIFIDHKKGELSNKKVDPVVKSICEKIINNLNKTENENSNT